MRLRILVTIAVSIASPLIAACGSSTDDTLKSRGNSSASSSSTGGSGGGGATSSASTGGMDAGPDVDHGTPSDTYPAFTPKPPTAVDYGGPVLTAPKIVPLFFANDDAALTAKAADFYAKVGATAYWQAATAEYGVGPITTQPPVQLSESAPVTIDDGAIQTWLTGKLNADDPALPAADGSSIYVINYPSGVTITESGGGMTATSCVDFGAYHNSVTLDAAHGAMNVAYAVIPRCDNFADLTGIDMVTAAASHELVEAATDPYPMTDPAYASVDDAHFYWLRALGGGETGDLCAQQKSSFTKFAELDYTVQRCWSNKSAKALHDPCMPALPGVAYFNSAPVLPDTLSVSFGTQSVQFKGVNIALGETKDVEIDLFSDGPTAGPWTVEAKDLRQALGQPPALDLVLDRTSGQNGEKLHLKVTVLVEGKHKTETFLLVSKLGDQENLWVGIVGDG